MTLQHLGGRGLLLQASRVSVISRAFSIAMTAWAAKFCNSAICLSVNGRTSWRKAEIAPRSCSFLEQRHRDNCARAAMFNQSPAHRADTCLRRGIVDLHVGSAAKQALVAAPGLRAIGRLRQNFREAGRHAAQGNRVKALAVKGPQRAERRLAKV